MTGSIAVATAGLTKRFGHQVAVDSPRPASCRRGRSTASSGPTARARPPRSGCCSGWSRRPRARVELLGQPMPAGVGRRPAPGRRAGRGAGVPPLPLRAATTWSGSTRPTGPTDPPHRAARGSTRRWTGSGCWPRRPSATAPTRWACGSGWRSPAPCCAPRDLLVLDEPTNGLDPQGTREVRSLVGSLADEGTHRAGLEPPALRGGADVHPHRRHARRAAGRPGHQRRAAGAAASPRRPSRPTSRPRPRGSCASSGCSDVQVTPASARRPARRDRAGEGGRGLRAPGRAGDSASGSSRPSLEDVFVSLTGEGFDVSG